MKGDRGEGDCGVKEAKRGSGGRVGGRSRNRQRYVQAIVVTPECQNSNLPLSECLIYFSEVAKKSVSARPGPILEGTLGSRMGPGRAGMAPPWDLDGSEML